MPPTSFEGRTFLLLKSGVPKWRWPSCSGTWFNGRIEVEKETVNLEVLFNVEELD